jgi:hypothetical protein
MGAPLATVSAAIVCSHGGQAKIIPKNTRVKAGGALVATQACTALIAGCPFTVPPAIPAPCIPAQWTTPATRVKVMGSPIITQESVGMTTGMGPPVPLQIVRTQSRVSAT